MFAQQWPTDLERKGKFPETYVGDIEFPEAEDNARAAARIWLEQAEVSHFESEAVYRNWRSKSFDDHVVACALPMVNEMVRRTRQPRGSRDAKAEMVMQILKQRIIPPERRVSHAAIIDKESGRKMTDGDAVLMLLERTVQLAETGSPKRSVQWLRDLADLIERVHIAEPDDETMLEVWLVLRKILWRTGTIPKKAEVRKAVLTRLAKRKGTTVEDLDGPAPSLWTRIWQKVAFVIMLDSETGGAPRGKPQFKRR